MERNEDIIATRYKELACAVLQRAYEDYMQALYYGHVNRRALKIDDMWFEITGINKEYFMKKVMEKGEERYGKKLY